MIKTDNLQRYLKKKKRIWAKHLESKHLRIHVRERTKKKKKEIYLRIRSQYTDTSTSISLRVAFHARNLFINHIESALRNRTKKKKKKKEKKEKQKRRGRGKPIKTCMEIYVHVSRNKIRMHISIPLLHRVSRKRSFPARKDASTKTQCMIYLLDTDRNSRHGPFALTANDISKHTYRPFPPPMCPTYAPPSRRKASEAQHSDKF